MNKEIEEMAKVISDILDGGMLEVDIDDIATALYSAGYRKQSDTARDILQKIKTYIEDRTFELELSDVLNSEFLVDEINKIAKQYGVELPK